jgi:UDP-N-acetyl-D-mannosaminuronate dehydrogenase
MSVSLLRESMDEAQVPRGRELTPAGVDPEARTPVVAVLGLGDAGLRTALALQRAGLDVVGIDTTNEARLAEADAILICADAADEERRDPGLAGLSAACAAVCRHARRGQTIVLTAVAYVGATRDLLVQPLVEAGFELGADICVACSPEMRPRLLGADGELCAARAMAVVGALVPSVHLLPSPDAAEALAAELVELAGERS